MALIGRRGLLRGMVALIAAPAIVRAASLMPVSVLAPERLSVSCAMPGDGGLALDSMPGPLGPVLAKASGTDAFGNSVTETITLSGSGTTQTSFRSISSITFTYGQQAVCAPSGVYRSGQF